MLIFVVSLTAMMSGCSKPPIDAPPEVHYGRDECAHCGMIVGDERFASALRVVLEGSTHDLAFDDIGDMFDYEREKGASLQVSRRYVHDYETKQWIDPSSALFIRSEELHTPMGSGIIAVSDKARAEALREKLNGKLLTFEELKKQT
jgi:copper chaperone NosL